MSDDFAKRAHAALAASMNLSGEALTAMMPTKSYKPSALDKAEYMGSPTPFFSLGPASTIPDLKGTPLTAENMRAGMDAALGRTPIRKATVDTAVIDGVLPPAAFPSGPVDAAIQRIVDHSEWMIAMKLPNEARQLTTDIAVLLNFHHEQGRQQGLREAACVPPEGSRMSTSTLDSVIVRALAILQRSDGPFAGGVKTSDLEMLVRAAQPRLTEGAAPSEPPGAPPNRRYP